MYLNNISIYLNILFFFLQTILFPNFTLANSNIILQKKQTAFTPQDQLAKMSLEEKIGQLFIIGFSQSTLDESLKEHIKKYKFGSFIFFKRNLKSPMDIKKFNFDLSQLSINTTGVMPLLAVDQEGGNVARIETKPSIPHFFHFGDVNDPKLNLNLGEFTGKLLKHYGFNLNLAPVLDLADSKVDSFISLRSFGNDPSKVSSLGYFYSKGLLNYGVIPTAKHFPGLGSLESDPHLKTVSSDIDLAALEKVDLKPFVEFTKLGPNSMVMLSHIIYPKLDSSHLPASFSKYIVQNLLREKIGFKGVILTDDLQMKSSASVSTASEASLKALQAGADMVMLSWSMSEQRKAFERVKHSVEEGSFSKEQLDEKVLRILSLKHFLSEKLLSSQQRNLASMDTSQPRFIDESSKELGFIQQFIFEKKLNNLFANKDLLSGSKLCLVSNNNFLINDFSRTKIEGFKSYNLPKGIGSKVLQKFFSVNICETVLVTLETLEEVYLFNSLKSFSGKNVVIINQAIPSALIDRKKYYSVLDFYGLKTTGLKLLSSRFREFLYKHDNYTQNYPDKTKAQKL